jgi:hypothetical protein
MFARDVRVNIEQQAFQPVFILPSKGAAVAAPRDSLPIFRRDGTRNRSRAVRATFWQLQTCSHHRP